MAKKAYKLFFPQNLIKEPIMHTVVRDQDLVLNIRRAKITADMGEAIIELEGDEENIENAVKLFQKKGVKIEPVEGDIIE